MTVYEQGVRNVPRNHRHIVHVQLINVFDYVDAAASRGIGRFDDP